MGIGYSYLTLGHFGGGAMQKLLIIVGLVMLTSVMAIRKALRGRQQFLGDVR